MQIPNPMPQPELPYGEPVDAGLIDAAARQHTKRVERWKREEALPLLRGSVPPHKANYVYQLHCKVRRRRN